MLFVVFAAPFSSPEFYFHLPLTIMSLLSIVSSLSSPAMHLGIPQDMESDPDDEVNKFFIITRSRFFFVVLSVGFTAENVVNMRFANTLPQFCT